MSDTPINERLASVETKLEFIQDLLKEIRDDLKDQPTREEYLDLKDRVNDLEDGMDSIKMRVFAASAVISILCSSAGAYLIHLLIGK